MPRWQSEATLEDLSRAAQLIQDGLPVPTELGDALTAGSSVGGARPKALLRDGEARLTRIERTQFQRVFPHRYALQGL